MKLVKLIIFKEMFKIEMNKSKRHVCHLVHSFDIGGLERIIVNCINNLDNEKFHHTIISLTHITDFINEINFPITHYSLNKKEGNDISVYFKLYRLLNELKPDVFHTYNLGTVEYHWVAMFARVPLRIHAEHGRDSYDPNGASKKYQLIRKICSYAIHRVVAVSQDLSDWLVCEVGIPSKKLHLIVNGIDTNYFNPEGVVSQELNELDGKFIFGHVARLHSIKNQTLMLKSFLMACKNSSEFSDQCILVIVGDGPDRKCLENFVSENPVLKERVLFTGSKTNVRDFYCRFDAFLMSSIAEGIPMTLLESMSMSIPHLVTLVGGIKEVIKEEETGLSVHSDDVCNYSRGLLDLFVKKERTKIMSVKARNRIIEKFNQDIMIEAYSDIYLGNG
ncbi:glycosyltransferase [Vibrio ziniensis]|uniref:Glycosyltransferase n=1 Tax=Vibrio ziniensis TaxID=2711221 RepID=A0A6G7CR85_9VIBR|nr:glycosyltransferase [Vibrio ziniensis]QIH44508.1 glycosyltransferase [Vibrio ziniensis]